MSNTYYFIDEKVLALLQRIPEEKTEEFEAAFTDYQEKYAEIEVAAGFAYLMKQGIGRDRAREFWDFLETREDEYLAKVDELSAAGKDLSPGLRVPELDEIDERHKKELEEKYKADPVFAEIYDALASEEYADYVFEVTNAFNQVYYTDAQAKLSKTEIDSLNQYLSEIDQRMKSGNDQALQVIAELGANIYQLEQEKAKELPAQPTVQEPQPVVNDGRQRPIDSYP